MISSLKENSFYNMGGRISEFATSILLAFLITRYLGKTGYGKYSLILAVASATAPLVDMGLSPVLVREMVQRYNQVKNILFKGLKLRFFAAMIASTILGIWVVFGGINWLKENGVMGNNNYYVDIFHDTTFINVVICALSILFLRGIAIKTSQDLLIAFEKIRYDFFTTLCTQVIKIFFIIVVIKLSWGMTGIFLAFAISDIFYILMIFQLVSRKEVIPVSNLPSVSGQNYMVKYYLKETWPIGLAMLLHGFGLHVDKFILKELRNAGEVGLFSVIYRIIMVTFIFIHPVINVFLPVMTRESEKGKGEKYQRLLRLLILFLTIIILGILVIAPLVIRGFGPDFKDSVDEFRWLVLDIFPVGLSFFFVLGITAKRKQVWVVFSALLVFLSNLIIDLFLVGEWGVMGAVVGTVSADILGFVFLYIIYTREYGSLNLFSSVIPVIVSVFIGVFTYSFIPVMGFKVSNVTWASSWALLGFLIFCMLSPGCRFLIKHVLPYSFLKE